MITAPRLRFVLRLTAVLLLLITACTGPGVNWDNRVGYYTYDQAVQELGPPKDVQNGPEGTRIAEWLTQRGTPASQGFGAGGAYTTPNQVDMRMPRDTSATPNWYLRLMFAKDGKLYDWKRIARYE